MSNYGNYGKQQWKELDKNTKSFSFRNSNAAFKSALVLGFWNSTMTIKIHPALPESQRSTEKVFDYNTYVMSVITSENALLLLEGIEENLTDPDFEAFGVSSGSSFVEISPYPAIDGVEDHGVFLNIYNKIDEQGNPAEVISYKFNSRDYFKNFKAKGKSMERMKTKKPSELLLFMTFLKEGIKGMSGGIAHGIRNANKYEYSRNVSNLNKMMEKLGITSQDLNRGYSNNNGGGYFNTNGTNGSASQSNDGTFDYSAEYGNLQGDRLDLD